MSDFESEEPRETTARVSMLRQRQVWGGLGAAGFIVILFVLLLVTWWSEAGSNSRAEKALAQLQVQVDTAATQAREAEGDAKKMMVSLNTLSSDVESLQSQLGRANQQIANLALANATTNALLTRVETEFCSNGTIRNMSQAAQDRDIALLWEKAFGMSYPSGNQFYPDSCNQVISASQHSVLSPTAVP